MLVRSWNLFHGNTVPPQRKQFLDDMLRLATADDPDILCLQEVPAWALGRFTVGDLAARPSVGPLPITPGLGHWLTAFDHGVLRSVFAGQGNAVVVSPRLRVLSHRTLVLNARRFRMAQARAMRLGIVARFAWAKERRIVQAVRLAATDGRPFLVANMHCTSFPADERLADAEVLRAAWFRSRLLGQRMSSCSPATSMRALRGHGRSTISPGRPGGSPRRAPASTTSRAWHAVG